MEKSIGHAVKLLFCCVSVGRDLEPVTKIIASSCCVLLHVLSCLSVLSTHLVNSPAKWEKSPPFHRCEYAQNLVTTQEWFWIQTEICLIQMPCPLYPATQLLFLGLSQNERTFLLGHSRDKDSSVLILLCISWNAAS